MMKTVLPWYSSVQLFNLHIVTCIRGTTRFCGQVV